MNSLTVCAISLAGAMLLPQFALSAESNARNGLPPEVMATIHKSKAKSKSNLALDPGITIHDGDYINIDCTSTEIGFLTEEEAKDVDTQITYVDGDVIHNPECE